MYVINILYDCMSNSYIIFFKGWNRALTMVKNGDNNWALFAKSVLDMTRLALAIFNVVTSTTYMFMIFFLWQYAEFKVSSVCFKHESWGTDHQG